MSSAIADPYARHTSDHSTLELTSAIQLIVTAAILYVPIILVLKHLYQKYLVVIFDQINEKLFLFITLLLAFCAFFIYGVMTLAAGIDEDRYYPLVGLITLYMVLTIVSVTIILVSTKKNFEQLQKIKDFNTLKEYTDTLEATYNNLRSFKHDYVNILSTLAVFIDEKRYDELDTFFHQNIMPLSRDFTQNNASLANLSRIKNLELKSIFYSKLLLATSKNIEITVDIPDEIEKPNIDAMDLSRILGIYLDNAIEAALETDHPALNVHSCSIDNGILFMISNSFIDHGISVSQMYKKGISSKGEDRGLGLYNVATILAKYDNTFTETSMENGLFIQKLQIFSK
nr:GHKL domain-containing protein [Butyrivibrio sp. WCE2006]